MHPEDIKAEIRKSGTTPAAIARQLGVSNMALTHAIRGNKSTRIAKVIATVTGRKFSELWPGRYPELEFVEAMPKAALQSAAQIEQQLTQSVKPRRAARAGKRRSA